MGNGSRTRLREAVAGIVLGALFPVLGVHIPLLAVYAWRRLRIPYIVAMPALFAMEMAAVDWLFFAGRERVLMLISHGIYLFLVTLLSFLAGILENRKRLLEGPTNFEGFVPAHVIFLLISVLIPTILKAMALAQAGRS